MPLPGHYLFLLGFASGVALLTVTGFRRLSPRWLRWLLTGSGLFLVSRYVTMALFTQPDAPQRLWALRYCWWASSISLPLASVMAIDQLLRHPAMTPRKLLRWFSPYLIVEGLVILFGHTLPYQPTPVIGWVPVLLGRWRLLLIMAEGLFVIGFVGIGLTLIRKVPVRSIQLALLSLIAVQAWWGVFRLLSLLDPLFVRPLLYPELAALLVLWYAYETSARLQESI